MKDLGTKQSKMFPSAVEEGADKTHYPETRLPLSVIEGLNLKVDDNVDVHIKGRISGMEDTKYSRTVTIEAKQGEVAKAGKEKEKSTNLMDDQK